MADPLRLTFSLNHGITVSCEHQTVGQMVLNTIYTIEADTPQARAALLGAMVDAASNCSARELWAAAGVEIRHV